MAYKGLSVNIPMGEMGLYTDDSQTSIPPNGLLRAENCELRYGYIQKQPGSRRWNANPLPSPIVQFLDWWPDDATQRMVCVTQDGRVWIFSDPYNVQEVTPVGFAPAKLRVTGQVVMVSGGAEIAGNPRKIFIFTGNDPVQVISGFENVRTNMQNPALDWKVNFQPSFGIIYQNRLWAFGNKNQPHFIYGSNVSDQEDFTTLGASTLVNVFPGDSEYLISAYTFKTNFILFKYPTGFYYLNTNDPANPFPQKMGSSIGAASALGITQVVDDLWVVNTAGSISSFTATNALGGLQQMDVVKNMKFWNYMLQETAAQKNGNNSAIWYDAKKMAMFIFTSSSGATADRILMIDFQSNSGALRAVMSTKDQPNCLGLVKDYLYVPRPFYGSSDGYMYQMDQVDKNVGGNTRDNTGGHAYTMTFQTPHLDFGWIDRTLSEVNKNFDFLEVTFTPTGNWNLSADIFIDNNFIETVSFNLAQQDVLDSTFVLNKSQLGGFGLRSQRVPIHGMGRRISVRFNQTGYNQNARITAVTIYLRKSGQEQRSV